MLNLVRFENWDYHLHKVVTEYDCLGDDNTFNLGTYDCALFFSKCIEAMTGHDMYNEYSNYSTEVAGYKLLRENGYSSIIDLIDDSFDRVDIGSAKRGDLCIVNVDTNEYTPIQLSVMSPAIILDSMAMSINPDGIQKFPYLLSSTVWSVG